MWRKDGGSKNTQIRVTDVIVEWSQNTYTPCNFVWFCVRVCVSMRTCVCICVCVRENEWKKKKITVTVFSLLNYFQSVHYFSPYKNKICFQILASHSEKFLEKSNYKLQLFYFLKILLDVEYLSTYLPVFIFD